MCPPQQLQRRSSLQAWGRCATRWNGGQMQQQWLQQSPLLDWRRPGKRRGGGWTAATPLEASVGSGWRNMAAATAAQQRRQQRRRYSTPASAASGLHSSTCEVRGQPLCRHLTSVQGAFASPFGSEDVHTCSCSRLPCWPCW